VLQILVLAVAGLIGTLIRQIPTAALHDPAGYARELADLHARYDPITLLGVNVGPGMVELFERLGFFRVFSAPWFTLLLTLLVVSIVVCTIDRTPRLWRGVRDVRIAQPAGFFDLQLSERARYEEASLTPDELAAVLRARRYSVRRADGGPDGASHVMGDRNRYTKMATLLTHTGLITFLAGGAVTGALGYETVLFVGEGQTAPVQPVGTPHNLLVKSHGFTAPRRADGSFADFSTDLSVYQDGREIGRKTIRVNDPLSVGGFVFHQNTFGPAEDLSIRDPAGRIVWSGPVILAGDLLGLPQGFLTVPGSDLGLLVLLNRDTLGRPELALLGLRAAGDGGSRTVFRAKLELGAESDPAATEGYRIGWTDSGAFTGMVVKRDPGQGLIWLAYLTLITGLAITFYLPRRRVWARLVGDRIELAMIADRYVDTRREFAQLLEEVTARTGRRPLVGRG
jgi:cytochrome c biogenesis protein